MPYTNQALSPFVARHIGPSPDEIASMLRTVGAGSLDQLMAQTIPASIIDRVALTIGAGLDEEAAIRRLREIAGKNQVFTSLIGQGYHGTILPGVIQRNILENPAW